MTTQQAATVLSVLKRADSERRGDYRVYERLKAMLAGIGLKPDEYESAVRRLARALNI